MKKAIQKMQAGTSSKKSDEKESGKIRTTISISSDLGPKSEKVVGRIRARRAANYSNLIEILIAEDTGLKPVEAVA